MTAEGSSLPDSLEHEIRTLRAQFWSARDPDGRAFAPLADAYRRQGELEEADSLLRDGLGRLPEFATGHLVAALVRRDQGRLDEAMTALNRVLELDPSNTRGLVERAAVAASLDERDAAREDVARALELEPSHSEAAALLRELEGEPAGGTEAPASGRPGGADQEGDGAVYTRTMGDLYARQGFHDRAIEVYEHLVRERPDDEELARRLEEVKGEAAAGAGKKTAPPAGLESALESALEPAPEPRPEAEEAAPQWMGADAEAPDEDPVTASAWTGVEEEDEEAFAPAPPGATVADYFEGLLSWVPGAIPVEALAPGARGPVPIESLAPDSAPGPASEGTPESSPEASPDASPESAPGGAPGQDDFQDWLKGLRR
jgi:tetratricopeptide (TPR) repeat protein